MATSYPTGYDAFTTISGTDTTSTSVGGKTHRAMHNDVNDSVEAIEAELGLAPSGSDATVTARLDAIEAGTRLATGSITSAKILDGTIVVGDLADGAVTSAKILDGTIVVGDLADGAVTSAKILDGTIATGDIADSAITSAKILDGTIVVGDLADGAVTSAKILDGTIVAGDLADSAVTSAKILDGTIVVGDLADNAVTSAKILQSHTTKTTTYTVTGSDGVIEATSGTWTATLPTAVGIAGKRFTIVNSGSGTITIGRTSSQTFDGVSANVTLAGYGVFEVVSDGANWKVLRGEYTSETVGRRAFKWNHTSTSGFQMVYGDTGWRGISTWTAGNTGLLADVTGVALNDVGSDASTQAGGFLPLSGSAGGIYMRRVNSTIFFQMFAVVVPALTATTGTSIWTTSSIPLGFRREWGYGFMPITPSGRDGAYRVGSSSNSNMLQMQRPAADTGFNIIGIIPVETSWNTSSVWPTSLPGTAYGSIPTA